MRVLFVSLPSLGHLFPLIPIAWAARAAGHEVLVATFGESTGEAARAGLPVVDIAPGMTQQSLFVDFATKERDLLDRIAAGDRSEEPEGAMFGTWGEWVADGAVAHAEAWRPDVVVHERMAPFGKLVAGVLDVPCVRHDLGIEPGELAGQLRHMSAALARHGVPDLADDSPWIDIVPPSLAPAGLAAAQHPAAHLRRRGAPRRPAACTPPWTRVSHNWCCPTTAPATGRSTRRRSWRAASA